MLKVVIYDTTLRDGSQTEGVSFSVNDKIKIAEKLDDLGIHYIEGGWPGSNPKDKEFFKMMQKKKLKTAVLAAFGSTRRTKIKASQDQNLCDLIASGARTVTIFGKSWDLHVRDVLRTTLEDNLEIIFDSVSFLKKEGREVFYDAEHFFDSYKQNPEYALKTILSAQQAKADCIVLCDTNGGTMPDEVRKIIREIKPKIKTQLGIHTHNDLDLAVANSLTAIQEGCTQVQGTLNGLGERCGNADLCTIIAILHTKMKYTSIPDSKIKQLHKTSYFLSEVTNIKLPDNTPFVGHSAFAHKGGVHIDAMLKNPLAYEHAKPEVVGNHRRFLTSELAGKMPIVLKAQQLNLKLDKKSPETKKALEALQAKEYEGYQYEAADASFELFMKREFKKYTRFFQLEGFKVTTEKRYDGKVFAEASIRLKVKGKEEFSASDGDGPVDALDRALRKALTKFYPNLTQMHLSDYKVRVLDTKSGTAAKVRVLIESQDETDSWTTIGVHENIIEASWEALLDSIEYKLLKDQKKK
ncbi:MAG TPA: citramalate synthase [Candidatus Omnitrophota bacterium]|nr:citramalate synthase [Candidatus Omnitrophota bacterium]HPD85227.1 citramalate synthase [Candidatus Omnitrophota bacterium]HRZ04272.1 citramalate synthase [Candidatus Omnitrophota bacterium]